VEENKLKEIIMKNLGTFQAYVVPEAASNRIRQINKLFDDNENSAYAVAGVYVVVVAYIQDRWYMKFCTTSHKRGEDKAYENKKNWRLLLTVIENEQLKKAVEQFILSSKIYAACGG